MIKTARFLVAGLLFCVVQASQGGQAASDFTLPTIDGQVTLSALHGQVVYLDFWASWCPPCRKSFPWMNQMHDRYAEKGLAIVAVNLDKERKLAETFLSKIPAKFTIALDPQGKVAELFQPRGMPTAYIIDRQGRIHTTHLGFRDRDTDELEALIEKLLAEKS